MKRIFSFPSRSKLLLAGLLVLAVTITLFIWFEVSQSREELLHFVESEAKVLIETVNRSTATTLAANAELEGAIIDRLRLAGQLVDARMESRSGADLRALAENIPVDLIVTFNHDGRISSSNLSIPVPTAHLDSTLPVYTELIAPVLRGDYSWLAQGGMSIPWTEQKMYLLSQERGKNRGVVLTGISASAMLEMRMRLGVGTLLRDIGSAASIEYVVLQDEQGLLTASAGVLEMGAIESDPFLITAFGSDNTDSRILDYAEAPTFEIVKRIDLGADEYALMRIGLSLDHVRAIQQRSMHRVIFIALGFFITAAILFVLLYTRQRFGILQQEHRKVRSYTGLVLDNIADAVVATDALGILTVFNQTAARLFGLRAADVLGRPCHEVCKNDTLLLQRTRADANPIPYEETLLPLHSGDQRTLAVSTSVIRDVGGAVETIVAIARDVTEQRHIQEQLQRKDRVTAMGELAGGIAHEIRNPLNAINIIAQRFQSEFVPATDEEEYLRLTRTVRSEVQRVNSIITQFLEFARPPSLLLQQCDVGVLLRESIEVVRSQAASAGVSIELSGEEELTTAADRGKMQQVLMNLLQNSIEALVDGGLIAVTAEKRGALAAITITDNGPGIPGENLKKIFNLYFTTKSTGTGLGLSIVHQIVSEHGGEISVSCPEDGGSSFQILLPLTAGPA